MTIPTERNRLADTASPYLRQHADNPVNWQPWDDQALSTAEDHQVPLFVSIGYSACHWCHVMEQESFSDPDVATVVNENFVPIKIDREERPDLDSIYMTVSQLVNGSGGWPLSAWCTPDGEPFYLGTYFPPESTRGRPGFSEVCERIAGSWSDSDEREEMHNRASQWTAAARDELEDVPDQPTDRDDESLLDEAVAAAVRGHDDEHGGFGANSPKFPMPGRVELLLGAAVRDGNDAAMSAVTTTLDAMASGGMYDQVGGGFHRYAVDREWTVPHFEKMLYDNAELPRVTFQAARATGRPAYTRVGTESLAFVEREMRAEDGAFVSTLGARSRSPISRRDGADSAADRQDHDEETKADIEEGEFYTWTPDEVDAVLDEPAAGLVKDRYGITSSGNFERGLTVPTLAESVADLAEARDSSASEIGETLMEAQATLFEQRETRPRPPRDEKVIAGWNGLMISAYAAGERALETESTDSAPGSASESKSDSDSVSDSGFESESESGSVIESGQRALDATLDRLWDGETLYHSVLDGDESGPSVSGYLDDYAFLARGAFDLYQVTGDVGPLDTALTLADGILERFYDPGDGTIYYTADAGEDLVARPQEFTDRSTPSSLGVAANLLVSLDGFTPREYRSIAEEVVTTHADRVHGSPLEHVSLTQATGRLSRGTTELTLAADPVPQEWHDHLTSTYLGDAILAPRPPTESGLADWLETLGLDETPPVWKGRTATDGEPTVYACQSFVCSPPKHDFDAALEWLSTH